MPGETIIPVSSSSVVTALPGHAPSEKGRVRHVTNVPIGEGKSLPCLWRSHYEVDAFDSNGSPIRAYECLLLISRRPITTIRAEVDVRAWPNLKDQIPVEW